MKSHEYWMQKALEEAKKAFAETEIPIGAALVRNNELIAANHNRTNQFNDPLAHAEKLVIEAAIRNGNKFLQDCTLYITVEPCLMCAGLIIWSRIGKVFFGCYDEKAGAVGSIYNALLDKSFNHNPEIVSGVLARECSEIITRFFKEKRN
ncbi:MAG: tRNA adenosine(34) deaminase TadA [Candidatus Cloacimonetes bacterium]|nr:tRNA adenosine(34) deaminase TadA [Candidatus Cloacimonadota bacterium]MCF7815052.1 tRNA adenosine(34) deaminase TadA [Candidatus Cloacimonadota bacterium]MCF7868555.1 tRNA adenosine(34) deaminase TadA [Candidatus Cloacimonadota bacterium]MCF7884267.1 tRNA adenosine(34) deaminase TadA [Candidatus Cloacimonadota bacterium]